MVGEYNKIICFINWVDNVKKSQRVCKNKTFVRTNDGEKMLQYHIL